MRNPLPQQRCGFEEYVPGPHPGCAEFAPPDLITCHEPATHTVKYLDDYEGAQTIRTCKPHGDYYGISLDARVYRFRTI